MKFNVNELKAFKVHAAAIKQNNIIPVLSYLRFKDGWVTKNNLTAFVNQSFDFKGSFLVDERILMNFIAFTNSPTIDISIKEKRVIITDGQTTVTSPTDDVNNYPVNEEPQEKSVLIDADILDSICIAANFAEEELIPSAKSFVFLGGHSVCACNGFVAYVDEFTETLPEMVLSKSVAATVCKLGEVKFSENDSYHFFESGKCKFGFAKSEQKFTDLTKFAEIKSQETFTIQKHELLNLNEMAISSTVSKFPTVSIDVEKKNLKFIYNDTDLEINISKTIPVESSAEGVFNYNPSYMNKVLRNVPDSELTFYKEEGDRYHITGDSGFIALLVGLAPTQTN